MAIALAGLVVLLAVWFFGDSSIDRSDLELLPSDSAFIVVANVEELMDSSLAENLRAAFSDQYGKAVAEMREEAGFGPEDVHQVVFAGKAESVAPFVIVVFKNELDQDQLKKFLDSLRLRNGDEREVNGHRVWGDKPSRVAAAELRSGTLVFGPIGDVEAALASGSKTGPADLIELLVSEEGLDAQFAAVFDWRVRGAMPRVIDREIAALVPKLVNHIGPVLVRAEIDDGAVASFQLFDTDGNAVVRTTSEIDGDFLERLLSDVGR